MLSRTVFVERRQKPSTNLEDLSNLSNWMGNTPANEKVPNAAVPLALSIKRHQKKALHDFCFQTTLQLSLKVSRVHRQG